MNFFKNITLLLFFGMITSPMHSSDAPVDKDHPTSFLGIMALPENIERREIKKARLNVLPKQQRVLEELVAEVEKRRIAFKQVVVAAVVDKSLSSLSSFDKEVVSPNSVATYCREKQIVQKPLKGILKKSK